MSDYISKSEMIHKIRGVVPSSQDVDFIVRLIEEQPTLDETEIIRKPFERVIDILKRRDLEQCANKNQARRSGFYSIIDMHQRRSDECQEIIKILKEECGING